MKRSFIVFSLLLSINQIVFVGIGQKFSDELPENSFAGIGGKAAAIGVGEGIRATMNLDEASPGLTELIWVLLASSEQNDEELGVKLQNFAYSGLLKHEALYLVVYLSAAVNDGNGLSLDNTKALFHITNEIEAGLIYNLFNERKKLKLTHLIEKLGKIDKQVNQKATAAAMKAVMMNEQQKAKLKFEFIAEIKSGLTQILQKYEFGMLDTFYSMYGAKYPRANLIDIYEVITGTVEGIYAQAEEDQPKFVEHAGFSDKV